MGVGEGKSGAPEAHVEEKEEDDRVLRHLGPTGGVEPEEADFAEGLPRDFREDEVEGLESRHHQAELDNRRIDVGPDGRPVHVVRKRSRLRETEPSPAPRMASGWRELERAGTRALHRR